MSEIPDRDTIRTAFDKSTAIEFIARPFNTLYRPLVLNPDTADPVVTSLRDLAEAIDLTPQGLRPVFNPREKVEKVTVEPRLPFTLPFGLIRLFKRTETHIREVDLPDPVTGFDQLGIFPFSYLRFHTLARVLAKPIAVRLEDEETHTTNHRFTVDPSPNPSPTE